MTLLAPDPTPTTEQLERELLIREARRRQRRRWFATALVAVLAVGGIGVAALRTRSAHRSESLLSRPLHFPSVGPGGRCPASPGYATSRDLGVLGPGVGVLGRGPIRVAIGDGGDFARGRVNAGTTITPRWYALQTDWFATPGYDGPFVVRAARIGGSSPIEVKPGDNGQSPGSGPLVVPAGPTANTADGYRDVPGSTWIKSPGCYAWQIDGRGFSELIVVDALAPVQDSRGSR